MIDSSPSSAESSFRELDEVFLQTQTRIWLGEVINSRLDEDLHLSELLQDGEILFEVSKVVWNLLLAKCMELRHLKHKYGPFGSRRSSGRYRPYSNVDSFIKICKILGLSGIDLFSPSDVVEKRDNRKVCICIRALSKKARSKQLRVPDFDMVIYSVVMPRNMVGVIRKGLESSQCTLSSSSSYSSRKVSQMKLKQNKLPTPCNGDNDYCSSDESDEAESRYMGDNAFSGKFNYDGVNSDLENLPEGRCIEEIKHEHCKSASLSQKSSRGIVSQKQIFNNGIIHVNNDARLENDCSVVGDSSCNDVGDSNYISNYLAFSDLMVHATDCSNSIIRDEENNMFDFFLNGDNSQGLSSNRSFRNGSQRKFSDDEDTEVSSTTSMSSVLGRLLNLEFDEHFDEDEMLNAHDRASVSKELREAEKNCNYSFVVSEPPKSDTYETNNQSLLFETREAQSETENEYELLSGMEPLEGLCGVKIGNPENHVFCSENKDMVAVNDNMPPIVSDDTTDHISVQPNLCETILDNHPCFLVKEMNGTEEDTPIAYNIQDNISYSAGENERSSSQSQDNKDASLRLPPGKHGQRPLLRTVVKGTAIAGVLFLLLHISGKGQGNDAQESKQHGQVLKYSDSKSSSTKKRQKKLVGKGIYPSEKINL